MDILNRPELREAAEKYAAACRLSREHDQQAAAALGKYGDHGPDISGAVRDHFPAAVKDHLRGLAREVSRQSDRARALRPARVRMTTMRRLAAAVAERDGSGFYGPQAA